MQVSKVVCILTAGKGTRMGELGLKLNKALHPINGKAIISWIIEKFPYDTVFVIGIGYLGYQVEQYLLIAHPDTKFKFIKIENYDGEGSGPGHSLLCCKDELNRSFYFVSCDTLWEGSEYLQEDGNWVGVARVDPKETSKYCNFRVEDGLVTSIADKEYVDEEFNCAFIGLCYIKDHQILWQGLEGPATINGEKQVSNGLNALIKSSTLRPVYLQWRDVGDAEKYRTMVGMYENYDFSKQDEVLYIFNDRVIKFFADGTVTKKRVEKCLINPKVFPEIEMHMGQFYSYQFLDGDTLYKNNNAILFTKLLKWLDKNLWIKAAIDNEELRGATLEFYKNKTKERLEKYYKKYPNAAIENKKVNGEKLPSMNILIESLPWEMLINESEAFFIHGDLQFDNIIYDGFTSQFKLLDWRQDFSGHVSYGDIYYDLAKLNGGIGINYDYIKNNMLSYAESDEDIIFDFGVRYQAQNYKSILNNFILQKKLSIKKVKILTALIYINMAPLHHFPFDKLLFSFGQKLLSDELSILKKLA